LQLLRLSKRQSGLVWRGTATQRRKLPSQVSVPLSHELACFSSLQQALQDFILGRDLEKLKLELTGSLDGSADSTAASIGKSCDSNYPPTLECEFSAQSALRETILVQL
jgi:hypothetical protein